MRSKKAIYNILTSLLLQVITILYGFIVPKIIISNFGSSVNGLVSSITQFLGYITLLESGFGPVVKSILYKPIANKDNSKIASIIKTSEKFFKRIALIFILYILVLCIIYPLFINTEFGFLFTLLLIVIISISTFAEYYFGMAYRLFLQSDQKNYVISIIQIITYVLSITFIIILAKLNCSIHIIKLISGLVFVFRPIIQNIYVKKKYDLDFKNVDKDYKIKNKWDGLAQHIASVLHHNTDVTVLTICSTLANVSIYSIYSMITNAIKKIVTIFSESVSSGFGDMIAKNEIENLNNKFSMFEVAFNTITTIIFTCSILLITPFISLYTKNFDINYCNYTFGYLIVIAEYICMLRLPYIDLTYAAGHFKETRIGAWFECITNIVFSLILVSKYGLVGVSIGTIIGMTIRTIEFMYHSNKYILKRNIFSSVKKTILVIIETLLIVFVSKYIPFVNNVSYINWAINSVILFIISSIITILINYIFFKKEIISFFNLIKSVLKRKRMI